MPAPVEPFVTVAFTVLAAASENEYGGVKTLSLKFCTSVQFTNKLPL